MAYPRWTPEEDALITKNYPTVMVDKMLELLPNHTKAAIRHRARMLGVVKLRVSGGYALNESYFDEWSPNMAYVLGLIYADGCIKCQTTKSSTQSWKSWSISIDCTDLEILEKVKSEWGYGGKIQTSKNYSKGKPRRKPIYRLSAGSNRMCAKLQELGVVQRKTFALQSPPGIPDNCIPPFLRGVWDGDGTISFADRPEYRMLITALGCASRLFLDWVVSVIEKHTNISVCKITKHGKKEFWSVRMNGTEGKKFLDWIYQDAELFLERKYQRYLSFDNSGQDLYVGEKSY